MSRRWVPIMSAMTVVSAVATAPVVSAAPPEYQYVRTVSGAIRCVISADHVGCERTSIDGFPGAPPSQSGGGNFNIAGVDADGTFNFGEGNIGGADGQEVVLAYDHTYQFNGWTVAPSFSGTRFTNDASGRGMFVSVDGVNPF